MTWVPVTIKCPMCGKEETNAFPADGLLKWREGTLIQRAMPEVNECLREFLITGHCEECRAEIDKLLEEEEV